GRAVVLDTLGDPVGMAVTEWLVERGWQVEVVTSDMFVGQRLTASLELTAWNQRAAARGIVFRPQFDTLEVTEHGVIGADHFDHREIRLDEIDLVVDVSPEVPDETLYFALKASGLRVFRAGDCVAPRYLSHAILEGYRAGREV
ncbi:MAG: mycofactocin system FadH/OYE family oxidoreductase 2, partial [Candidatus Competibacter phosphatis]